MENIKINRELLCEVLGHDDVCNERIIQNKLLYMCKNDGMMDYEYEYNIYEFAFRCKEWASNKGYSYIGNNKLVDIYIDDNKIISLANNSIINWCDINIDFIACEWILSEKS